MNAASCFVAAMICTGSPPPSDAGSSAPFGSARSICPSTNSLRYRSTIAFQPAT